MCHCFHKVLLPPSFSFGCHHLLYHHEAGHDGSGLAQEPVQHLQAGGDALGPGAPDYRVIVPHGLQHDAHISDGTPLDGEGREAIVTTALTDTLHGRIGEAVVALASISAATADRREGHKVLQVRAALSGHSGRTKKLVKHSAMDRKKVLR